MPDLEYFVVAEGISIDQNTDRVTLFNVLEELSFAELPSQLPQFFAVCSLKLAPGEEDNPVRLTLIVHRPESKGAPHPSSEFILEPSKSRRRRAIWAFFGYSFTQAGDWRIELLREGGHCATHTLTVSTTASPALVGAGQVRPANEVGKA